MYLIDGDDLYEVEESDVELEADGSGFWVCDSDDGSESFYDFCELDEEEYDFE